MLRLAYNLRELHQNVHTDLLAGEIESAEGISSLKLRAEPVVFLFGVVGLAPVLADFGLEKSVDDPVRLQVLVRDIHQFSARGGRPQKAGMNGDISIKKSN